MKPSPAGERLPMTDTEAKVVAFLSEGTAYGLPGAKVARIETHCSIVFLVGNRAYKLKRPIAFSALDYRTVEKREAACRAELAINRRTAPELYLGVKAVHVDGDGNPSFAGEGTIVDWVVEMRRFDQADLFDHLADRDRLTEQRVQALADEIAWFHASSEPVSTFGGASGLRTVIERNREDQRTIPAILPADAVAALFDASIGLLNHLGPLLDRRRDEGRVRRCHGDLRLANICLVDERPTLFDAVEFCDEACCIDVIFDLAFVVAELYQRGLDYLASVVLNRYLDITDDAQSLAALPLMLSVRAASRAHTLALSAQRHTAPEESRRMTATAQSYLALASAVLAPRRAGLVAIGGLGGSTKSELARGLAAALQPAPGARILRSDVARKRLLGLDPGDRLPSTAYAPETNARVYARLRERAARTLNDGFTVIVEASFLRAAQREAIASLAASASIPFLGLWLGEGVEPTASLAGWRALDGGADLSAVIAEACSLAKAGLGLDVHTPTGR